MAAADYAEGGEPPPELKLAHQCKTWNTLPEAGGLLDQPAGLMDKMSILMNVVKAHKEMYASDNWAEWITQNPQGAEIINRVKELRNG